MINFFKNKYKLINSIYIFFLFILIFFIKFSTIGVLANSFKIVDLEISKPYDKKFNKEKVIDTAFEKAFQELILRITTLKIEEVDKLTNLKSFTNQR